jgi:hypothetical protein
MEQEFYSISVNGKTITPKRATLQEALQDKELLLSEDQKMIAEIVSVASDNKQLLLG